MADRRLATFTRHLLTPLTTSEAAISTVKCCGIIAVVGKTPAVDVLVEGLKILEARGYDSAGISTVSMDKTLITTKYASAGSTSNAIELLSAKTTVHGKNSIGIAHTRWATHGGATDQNAHPHLDEQQRVAVVHNGVIENYSDLKKQLVEDGVEFSSETDTEVIAQMGLQAGKNLHDAVTQTVDRLQGTWGLVILDREDPSRLLVAKNGSPMLIGVAEGRTFVASEPSAFVRYTKNFIALQDREIAVVTATGHSLDDSRTMVTEVERPEVSPDPFPNWTIKEIMEQPQAIARALNYGGRLTGDSSKLGGLDKNAESLKGIKHLIIAACGTSYYSGLAGAYVMRYLKSFDTVRVVDAAELSEMDLPQNDSGVLVISQSGETKDVHRALTVALNKGLPVMSIVNVVGSLIARSSGCGVYINAGRENAVASTKAFTAQATVLCLIALWFSKLYHPNDSKNRAEDFLPTTPSPFYFPSPFFPLPEHKLSVSLVQKAMSESLHRLPTNVGMLLQSRAHDQMKEIAKTIHQAGNEHIFVLGKGAAMPIAFEGALKIKELSYIHAEGYPGGSLKHGPFALIEKGMPIIFIILDDEHAPKMITAVEETRARGAYTITITNVRNIYDSHNTDMGPVVHVPSNGLLTSILTVIPLQLLAYELSLLNGVNPDRPRHLAKTVTVD